MGRILFIVFLLVPLIEIVIFIGFGQAFGLWPTLLGIVATALIGSFIIRIQGLALFEKIRQTTASGALPAKQLAEAMMVAIAGAFLLTPGYFTDFLGFLLLVPMIRSFIYQQIKSRFSIIGQSYKNPEFTDGNDYNNNESDNIIDLDDKDWRK